MTRMIHCMDCGDFIDEGRSQLGYMHCKSCGEVRAVLERGSWCVVQEYGKGSYQLVTPQAAYTTLKQTNQKNPR